MGAGLARVIGYVMMGLLPVVMAALLSTESERALIEIGKSLALLGFTIVGLQVLLAARIKWIERAFGLDILLRFHKHMGVFAAVLLVCHPVLLAAGGGGWRLIFGLDLPWHIWLGKLALVLLLFNVLLSVYQRALKVKFEKWRNRHDVLGPLLIASGFAHSWFVGDDLESAPMRALWVLILASGVCVFAYHRFLRPWRLGRRPYCVEEVKPEAKGVWTVKLTPCTAHRTYDYLPGQFHFITFRRGRDLPVEEHHWTISSSPAEGGSVSSTIKELGDFTSTIGETRAGDTAVVHGAFGRFSYALHPDEKDLVFLAGGIGITPLMSMLRHMRQVRAECSVVLLYANRTEGQIVFRDELSEMEAGEHPRLKVVHVLDAPEEGWTGEEGRVDREKIEEHCGSDLNGKTFYVCGPPGMRKAVIGTLRDLGVPDRRIRLEIFSFLD